MQQSAQQFVAALRRFIATVFRRLFSHQGNNTMTGGLKPSDPKFDSHFAAIGRVADAWAQLEFYIDQAIWEFAGVNHSLGACITSQMIGLGPRTKAVVALAEARKANTKSVEKLSSVLGRAAGLQESRHRAIHDPRHVNKRTGKIERLQVTAKKSLVFGFQPEPVDGLRDLRGEIDERTKEFIEIRNKIAVELNTLPEKDQPELQQIVPVTDQETPPNGG